MNEMTIRPSDIFYCDDNEGIIFALNDKGQEIMIPYGTAIFWEIVDETDEQAYKLYFG